MPAPAVRDLKAFCMRWQVFPGTPCLQAMGLCEEGGCVAGRSCSNIYTSESPCFLPPEKVLLMKWNETIRFHSAFSTIIMAGTVSGMAAFQEPVGEMKTSVKQTASAPELRLFVGPRRHHWCWSKSPSVPLAQKSRLVSLSPDCSLLPSLCGLLPSSPAFCQGMGS